MNVNHIMQKLHATGFATHQSLQSSLPVAGKLRHFVGNWQVLTADHWVLNTVQGFLIPFREEPRQVQTPHPYQYPADQLVQLREELALLVSKGAITRLEPTTPVAGFYSTVFLVPKKEGRWRPVINLKALNSWVQPQHFKMEGIHTLRELLVRNDWLAKLDLKDAYFTVPIHRDHQKYLRFVVEQVHYQFTCLPFGLSCAPWAFTKVLRPVAAFLRTLGVRMIVYIDDMLIMGESPDVVWDHVTAMVALLEGLGFIVNTDKSMLSPTQQLEFLGLQVSSVDLHLRLPGEKIKQIRIEASQLLRAEICTARKLAQFIGRLNAAAQAVFPAPLFYRHLQRDLQQALSQNGQDYNSSLQLSREAREEIQWWQQHLSQWNGRSLIRHQEQMVICSDASLAGWGAVCGKTHTGGPWSPSEQELHINCLELKAATLALQSLVKDRMGISVLLQLDSQTAVLYINHLGGTVSPQLTDLAKNLWLWSLCRDLVLTAQHIPGVDNQIADSESRELKDRLDWKLSPAVFRTINAIWGPLEVDLFASRLSHQLSRFFSWRLDPLAEATNAFQQDWAPVKGYANPWCLIGKVLNQVRTQQAQVILVAPVWRGQPWYPVLLEMLWDYPRLLPQLPDLFQMTSLTVALDFQPQLAAWPISGGKFASQSLSRAAGDLLLSSWRTKSNKTYDSHFKKWVCWCTERGSDPVSGPVSDVANFLADLHGEGYQSSSLNVFRSAISSIHDKVDGVEVGKHPIISRLLKGAFHLRPPLPRYSSTWSVDVVLQYLKGLGPTATLSLKSLTHKLVMLLALTRPSRSADLASLNLDRRRFSPEGVAFLPSRLAKQSRQGRPLVEYFFPSFPHDPDLCPVRTLRQYELITSPLRGSSNRALFLAMVKPHLPVASCTIARWLKKVLEDAGIDVSIFSAHSVRGASSSAAALAGVTTNVILEAADWSTESVFRRFYYKPRHSTTYGDAVLSASRQ